ncbi:TonB-dependent receptor [Hirschia litorea]|uniref:TonB-dependent receptor n=1 Tax=Hirschia litorea TaxID=1199156 RepID=A0ABW2IPF6_9PROT
MAGAASVVVGAGAASAQELTSAANEVVVQDENKVMETVVITGIRKSLIDATAIKRNADGVVDAISAEDIGKFPDTNLAESLQRITGVSIDRSNGEGNQVTVRGFGPSFNLVTLNNRQMPTSSTLLEEGINRSFNFRELAAESVSGVEVYKTGRANVSSGGIGSTINIKTAKPFDYDGFKFAGTVKGNMDTSVEEGRSVTPEISGLISKTFLDDKLGILLSVSHAERDSRRERVGSQGWPANRGTEVDKSGIDTSNNPNQTHWLPLSIDVDQHVQERTRQNGQLVLQYAPTDRLTMTADYTLSRFEETDRLNRSSFWFDTDAGGNADADGTVTNPMRANDELNFWSFHNLFETENDSVGFNVDWKPTDSLSLQFDFHDSTSHAQPDGQSSETIINLKNPRRDHDNDPSTLPQGDVDIGLITRPGGRPDIVYDDSGFPTGNAFSSENIVFDLFQTRGFEIKNNIQQAQLHGQWANLSDGALRGINFGAAMTDYQIDTLRRRTVVFAPVDISALDLQFSPVDGFGSNIGGDQNLFPVLAEYDALEALQLAKDQGFYLQNDPTFNAVNEETISAYLSFDVETEFNKMPVSLNAGIRYEDTQVTASSLQNQIIALNYVNTAGRFFEIFSDELTGVAENNSYSLLLPNVDFRMDVLEDVVGRFSYSRTISRPDLSSMFPSLALDARPGGPFNASRGNANLSPLSSDNIDFTAEWYYDDASYASVGYFHKYVQNFIGTSTVVGSIPDINGNPLRDPSINPRPGCPDEVQGGNPDCFSMPTDPVIEFSIAQPDNIQDAEVYGWELNIQHTFGETGFGIIGNVTLVESDLAYDVYDIDQTVALTGLSDSANIIGFYEKGPLQARLAYNWRDDFLLSLTQPQRPGEPVFVESYGQFDVSASYEINDNFSVFLEGLNITDETTRSHGRFPDQIISMEQLGPRFAFGVRAAF